MLPVIRIGPAAMQSSALALIAALWLGAFVAEREFKRRGLRGDDAWNSVAIAVAVTLVTARLVYVAQNLDTYADAWIEIFAPVPGTLALEFGAVFGILAILGYFQHRRLDFKRVADALAPGALVACAIIAIGQFLSGDAFGTPAELPWSIVLWGAARHPVQLYDAFAALIGLAIIRRARAGLIALTALAWYSAARLFVDGFRADAAFLPGGYRTSQVIALAILLIALALVARKGESNVQVNQIQTNDQRSSG
ncbi:Phosphatidylglycerol--prolipoprotein diacylglyceryl transferase [Anaerolineae bacterium]|nr:Phosphatidylglycerol--prolipoprotein diacylglyceryl transferase [Anaerolineae bacterium]